MALECSGKDEQLGAAGFGLLLDRIARPASLRGRFPTDAIGYDSTGGRCPSPDGKHLHLPVIHPALLEQGRSPTQAATGDKNEKLWIRLDYHPHTPTQENGDSQTHPHTHSLYQICCLDQ